MDEYAVLPRRMDATETDLLRAGEVAEAIATATLGRDAGPMVMVESLSHYVYIGPEAVVKLVDTGGHTRLNREIALMPHLPPGLGAPLLGSGRFRLDASDVRYACFTRMPGKRPGIGLPGVDVPTARRLADQAVRHLDDLHNWHPSGDLEKMLRGSRDPGGFVGQAGLVAEIEGLAAADRDGVVPRHMLDDLMAIAERGPARARTDTPVHADCDWGNWLTIDGTVTALIDFERAHLGDPVDDWLLLAVTSGPHLEIFFDTIVEVTGFDPETLRAECEVRDAAFVAEDVRAGLELPEAPEWMVKRLRDLEELTVGRRWQQNPGQSA